MKNNLLAYLLWLPPFGFLGVHKAYLGKPLMAIIYFLTGGGCFFGWASDLFTLPKQVREANYKDLLEARDYLKGRLGYDLPRDDAEDAKLRRLIVDEVYSQPPKAENPSPEKAVLRLAFEKQGRVTVGDVAMGTDLSLDEAEDVLKELTKKGHCGMHVTDSGLIEYEFQQIGPGGKESLS